MSYAKSLTHDQGQSVSSSGVDERVAFIRRTYLHLAGAIIVFVLFEALLFEMNIAWEYVSFALSGRINWLVILGLFMVVGWLADRWAHNGASKGLQYIGLALYTFAEAILFMPLLVIVSIVSTPVVIPSAAIISLSVFIGLTAVVFLTKADFSFLRMGLIAGGLVAIALIVSSLIFGFNLGVLFSAAMVGLAAGYILYNTSGLLHSYNTDQHVAASLALFADFALLFWYVLRLLSALNRR
ncbi:MAG TPA: Bax inhibitor-1 family protein [candidate division Zixibacteria bacterium]|nr:Bax inhibitor-1 family protein [candidate division Zixibacteria bacterium]